MANLASAGVSIYDPSFSVASYDNSLTNLAGRTPKNKLDPDTFMKLLVAQLRYQDPLKGTDQQQFMQQVATLNQIQQQSSLNDKLTKVLDSDSTMRAMALIGHTVKGTNGTDAVSGKVDSVTVTDGVATLNVGTLKLPVDGLAEVS